MHLSIRSISLSAMIMLAIACSSSPPSDRVLLDQAMSDLSLVRAGLGMYQVEDDSTAFPTTSAVTGYEDLLDILAPYVEMPASGDVSWTFVSYLRARPDTFVLKAKALDTGGTILTVTALVRLP